MAEIHLLDTIVLAHDLPTLGLVAGEIGAVVAVHGDGTAFEVEFVDSQGSTYGLHTLKARDVLLPHTRSTPWRQRVAA